MFFFNSFGYPCLILKFHNVKKLRMMNVKLRNLEGGLMYNYTFIYTFFLLFHLVCTSAEREFTFHLNSLVDPLSFWIE